MTSEEKAAGSRPSAIDSRPWPPVWLIQAMASERREAPNVCGSIDCSSNDGDDEQDRRGDHGRLEGEPRRGGRLARRLHGEEIEAEEDAGRDAEDVAERAGRPQLEALREQRRAAGEAQAEPGEHARRRPLAEQEPAEQHDPDRRGRGEEGRVGDAGVDDRQVPEEEIAGEGEPGQDRRAREPLAGRLGPSASRVQA